MGKETVTPMPYRGGTLTDDRIQPAQYRTFPSTYEIYLSDAGTVHDQSMQQACWWSVSVSDRLNELERLAPGWDGCNAIPPDRNYLSRARDFLSSDLISGIAPGPDLVPTYDGGLLIEWHTEVIDLIIELGPAGNTFYVRDNETNTEVEAALGDSMEQLASAFMKLGLGK